MGISIVPQGRQVFSGTVRENLEMGAFSQKTRLDREEDRRSAGPFSGAKELTNASSRWATTDVHKWFMRIQNSCSDEPLFLAKIDERTIQKIQDIRDEGTMILMWSKMPRPRQIADKIFVLEEGKVA